jgi:hypothetical protein
MTQQQRRSLFYRLLFVLLLTSGAVLCSASVHDIHLHTDSTPDYTSIEDYVATATGVWNEPEDQAIALWRWMVRSHLQTSHTREDGRPIWDPMLFYGSYPNTFCGYMAAYLTSFVDAMGGDWRHRYIELGDHTVAEVSWDAGATWHMFDTSMVVYARRHDGSVASCDDIAAASSCSLSDFWGVSGDEPGHLYMFHTTQECMTNPPDPNQSGDLGFPSGYRKACDNPIPNSRTLRNGADSYTSGFETQTAYTHVRRGWVNRLNLKPNQTYTRSWTPLGSGSEYARLTSHGDDPNDTSTPSNIRSNGFWEINPDLSDPGVRSDLHHLVGIVHRSVDGGTGPALRPAVGNGSAEIIAKLDAFNVVTSARIYLEGERGAGDQVALQISRDAGCSWTTVHSPAAGSFSGWHDLDSSLVGGAFEVLVRVLLEPDSTRLDCGIDVLGIDAITQLNRMTLPRLQRGSNQIRFAAGPAVETLALRPTLHLGAEYHWSNSADSHWGLTSRDDANGYSNAILVPTLADQEGVVTWRIDTPTDMTDFEFGGSFITRASGTSDDVQLQFSWDGETFVNDQRYNSESSPTWDGRLFATPDAIPSGQRSVWLRYNLHGSVDAAWNSTGIQEALLQVRHEAYEPVFDPVEVTWSWIEHRSTGDVAREHTRIVTDPTDNWAINVGGFRDPTMVSITTRLDDGSASEGYSDGENVGTGAGYDKIIITDSWENDVALGRPYTASRPATASNPDDGGTELTDGTVIPPTNWTTSFLVMGQAAYWDGDAPLTVTVDLESPRSIKAVRVTTHQPNAEYGHAGTITVTGISGGSTSHLGVIQHDDIWSPPGDHLDWGYQRSGNFTDLPAGGRLTYGYWLVLDQPVTADEIQLDMLPLAGHGLGISEIQVFSDISVGDWPDREVDLIGGPATALDPTHDDIPLPIGKLNVAPNPANPGTTITYSVARPGPVSLQLMDLRGRVVRTLLDGWRASGSYRARWDGRDDQGHALSSGRYLAVFTQPDSQSVGHITLVR